MYNNLFWGPRPASYLILAFVSFYLLMLSLGVRSWVAIAGALAFGFCSYNFQIMQVGHNAKMVAIAFMPMVLASVIFAFSRNRWLGAVFLGISLAFEIMANHPQITFYLAMVILFYGGAQLYLAIKNKTLPSFIKTGVLLLVAAGLAAGANVNHLWPTWEYTKYTMRGGSELTLNQQNQTENGLDKEYATAWSYGIEETFNLLIPNFNGGASAGELGKNSETYKFLKQAGAQQADQIIKQLPLYWGPQSFTAGPMYMGAVAIFLFVLGLVLIKGPMKWWIASLSLLVLLLGWGRHFMVLSNLFYDYVPLYNKFRVPSMILVVLQLTIPLLGFYTVWKIVKGDVEREIVLKGLKISLLIVGGICALFVLLPGLAGSFSATADSNYPDWLQQCLPQDRKALLRSDALRSLVFVVLTAGCIWGIVRGKLKMERLLIVLCVLLALDMWTVDKRYLNNGHFVTQREFNNQFQARPVDKIILEDESLDYRVLDLSVNTFNDSHSSYFHKTIGGYSAAKLQRYQDLIDYFIAPKIDAVIQEAKQGATYSSLTQSLSTDPILNMLNTKYIIVDANSNPIENRSAYGNAWFVKDYELVNTADEEIIKLAQIEPSETAIIAKEFAPIVKDRGINFDDSATIQLISYAPNKLEYRTRAKDEQLAVFSEIYYPKGWHVYVDGQEVEHFRTDYVLRAMFVPAGEHVITFEFRPDSYFVGSKISAASSGLLLFALFGFIMVYIIRYYRKDTIARA